MSPPRTKFETAKLARAWLLSRGMRLVTRRSNDAGDRVLAEGMPDWGHWGFVSTAETAGRAPNGEVGVLIGWATWTFGDQKLHVRMRDVGQLPRKGRRGRGAKRTKDGEHLMRTVRIGFTRAELPEFHAWNKAFFERVAGNRTSGRFKVDGITYTSKTT